jgi:HPt (histidine-containing phosphotransfer) domain-containing protein
LALNSKYGGQTSDSGSLDARDAAWSACEKHYNAAIAQYNSDLRESEKVLHPKRFLLAVCQADLAKMQFDRANYDASQELYANALGDLDKRATSPLFQTHSQCMLGAAFTRDSVWYDADLWLKEAETSAKQLPANHPLRAFVLENRGWFLVKKGNRGREAQESFARANQLRRSLASADFRQNIFLFHNEHGQAMALHLTQDPQLCAQAKKNFAKLRQDIETELKRVKDAPDDFKFPPQYRLDLLERLVNAGEREADCYLFSVQPERARAAKLYVEAIRFAQSQGLDTSRLLTYVAQMQYSLVLALRLQEEPDSPPGLEATTALSVADATYRTMPRKEQLQLVLFSRAAQAIADPLPEQRLNAAKEIESLLRKKREDSLPEIAEGKQENSHLSRDERQLRALLEQCRQYLPTEAQSFDLSS